MNRKSRNDLLNEKLQTFLANGGEIVKLAPASKQDQKAASRLAYHQDRAMEGDERSQQILNRLHMKEESLIFSREERMKA